MSKIFKQTLLTSSVVVALFAQQAYATNGYTAHGYGTLQKAMGGTAVAGSDNAMNIATNPASMSFGENNWTVGLEAFVPDRGSTLNAATGVTKLDGNRDSSFFIPEFAYQRKINDKFAAGIAVYGNGGLNATYDTPIFGANPATSANSGVDLAQLFIAPSVAMKVNEKHSFGASLNLVYQRFEATGVDGFGPVPGSSGFSSSPNNLSDKGYDNSTGIGITLGWQGKLSDAVTAGFSYKSKTRMSKFDKYKGLFAEQGDFDIPSMITAGFSVQSSPKTTFAVDIARINYTDVKSVSNPNNTATLINRNTGVPDSALVATNGLGTNNGAGFGWDDQNIIKLGMKHKWNDRLTLLGGFNHGKAPIDESQTAFNVLATATVETHLTLGLDWKLAKGNNITVQYMHAFDNEIKGDGTSGAAVQVAPGVFANADIEMEQDAIGISYTRNF